MTKTSNQLDSDFITSVEIGNVNIESDYDLNDISKSALKTAKERVNSILRDLERGKKNEKKDKSEWDVAIKEYNAILKAIQKHL